jgi:uncharacterized protein (DUF2252 family)
MLSPGVAAVGATGASDSCPQTVVWLRSNERSRVQGVFDFVDADAAWVASYLHDVYRLSTALAVLASGELGVTRFRYEATVTFVNAYIEQLRLFDSQPDMKDVNAAQVHTHMWQAHTAPHSGWRLAHSQLQRLKQSFQVAKLDRVDGCV